METNGVNYHRHRKTTSSDRFLAAFSLTNASSADHSGDELTEADLFWTGGGGLTDSSDSIHSSISPESRRTLAFRCSVKSGILAALPDDCGNRLAPPPPPTPFRTIPKTPQRIITGDLAQSVPCRKFQHSAPMNVPSMMRKPKKFRQLDGFSEERENEEEEEMLPPHEIVAMKLKSTSSVLEGVGRTLKGRDLRQVRNAVWRQTGFMD
ncbi:protein S40-6 [Spinacia oleracea]|uniref:Protein S40-6 n=1 Tax=Spinacia oleracea TaxID=3562 RepID=A0A9R0JZ61_SPIOL|nr:protein S40-6-like [Spinacia oleracea]